MRVARAQFGRCIAGQGMGGNFGWFKLTLLMASVGPVTTMVLVVAAMIMRFGPIGIMIAAGLGAGLVCTLMCSQTLCFGLRLYCNQQLAWRAQRASMEGL